MFAFKAIAYVNNKEIIVFLYVCIQHYILFIVRLAMMAHHRINSGKCTRVYILTFSGINSSTCISALNAMALE